MKSYYIIIILQLLLITQELELNIRQLRKASNKTIIEAGISIITILGCILFIIFFVSNIIRKRNLQRTIRNNLNETKKQLNLKKKEYLFQNELKPKILKLKLPEKYFNECAICLENIKENDIITNTPCNHIFHFDCFKEYMFVTTDTHCPLCKFDFFSILNGKEIDFENINIENNNPNNIKTEECFINNIPSNRSNVNKKEMNIFSIRKIFFSSPNMNRNKGYENNDENDIEVTTSKLKLTNKQNDKIIFFSDYKTRNINSERFENKSIDVIN
jgi:hypothetical protein